MATDNSGGIVKCWATENVGGRPRPRFFSVETIAFPMNIVYMKITGQARAVQPEKFSSMPFNPYPATADLRREADAEDRDVADLVALRDLRRIVADAIARASRVGGIQHPDRRWSTADLLETLQEQLADIDDTAAMIRRSPLVLEDA
jgi:hypothetical protein